jgi:hypothetical protein
MQKSPAESGRVIFTMHIMKQNLTARLVYKLLKTLSFAIVVATSAVNTVAQPYPSAVLGDNPVAYWRLEETSGTIAYDSSAAGTNNGIYTNAALDQTGYAEGLATEFGYSPATDTNASAIFGESFDSYVSGMPIDFASTSNTSFSLEAWVNGSYQGEASAGIVGKGWGGGGEECYLDCGAANNAFRFFVRTTNGQATNASSTFIPDGYWHHLVGVCNESQGVIDLYIDGQLAASAACTGGIHSSTNQYLVIGSRQVSQNGDYTDQFVGTIGQVAVYNYALNAAKVQNHYLAAGIPATITVQPTNQLTLNAGASATVTVGADGTAPLTYWWTTNGVIDSDQTNNVFSLTNVQSDYNSVALVAIISNAYGTASSDGTYITVNSGAPQIQSQVQPQQLSLYIGEPWTYSVVASGNLPFYYQWLVNGTPVSGATNSTFTYVTASGANNISVNVSNAYNGGSVTSSGTATLMGVPVPTNSYPATIVAAGPIAYWRLDEPDNGSGNSGFTANDYAGGHSGVYNQVLLGIPGYSIDDADTAAGFGTNASPTNLGYPSQSFMQEVNNSSEGIPTIDSYFQSSAVNLSVECWVKSTVPQNTSGSTIIGLGSSGSQSFLIDASGPSGEFRFVAKAANGTAFGYIYSPITPLDGNWHHLVAVIGETASGTTTFYVDGNLAGTLTAASGQGLYSTSIPLYVGGDNSYQFNGTVDEVSIYNYALTIGQVVAHFHAAPEPPVFESFPAPVVTSHIGGSVTLSATELGSAPLANQWYSNNVLMAGQTNVSLILTNLSVGTNIFTLSVANAYGVSNTPGTTLQVPAGVGAPVFVANVTPAMQTLYTGETATYSVLVSGSLPITYQWYSNNVAVSDATNASYTIPNLTTNDAGSYYCAVGNSFNSLNSGTAVLNVTLAPTNPYSLTVMADHPTCYWRLDEANGSTNGFDEVGGNVGVYSNTLGVVHGTGIFGSIFDADPAAYFNSTTNYTKQISSISNYLGTTMTNYDFSVPNGLNGAFTVEAWARAYAGVTQASGGGIVAKGYGNGGEEFNLDVHAGFRFYSRTSSGGLTASAQAASTLGGNGGSTSTWAGDGNWHHLVGVCDEANDNLLLYVDGQLIGSPIISNGIVPATAYLYQTNHNGSTGTNGLLSATPGGGYGIFAATNYTSGNAAAWGYNSVSIGCRNSGSGTTGLTLAFRGGVDEVALYNYCLTPLQVSNHFAVAMNMPTTLNAQTIGGHTVLTWYPNFATAILQGATNLNGPWTNIVGATSPYVITNGGAPAAFYRLQTY